LILNKELPYSLKVETEKWEELRDGSLKLYQAIIVLKDSHKSIVVGDKGSKIKSVGERSRKELQKVLNKKVHLFLYVKVKSNWIETELH
jgi:GTP-binding protein Era